LIVCSGEEILFYIDRVPDRHFDWFAEGWRCFIRAGSILGSLVSLNFVQRIDGTILMRIFLGILLIYSSNKMIFPPARKS
jgi:uncharacterized membrane protein YfcA